VGDPGGVPLDPRGVERRRSACAGLDGHAAQPCAGVK
jgi:hypothetical protein